MVDILDSAQWSGADEGVPTGEGNIPPSAYAENSPYMRYLMDAASEAQGYKKEALRAQIEDARAARANAMKIAQLQASTSRYGIDVASRDRMAALKEQAREFDARHGLDIAEAYTRFASTPDMMWARNDFVSAMNRVGQGRNLPQPITSNPVQPQPKTWQDFSAIAQYNGSQVPGASSSPAPSSASSQPQVTPNVPAPPGATSSPSAAPASGPVSQSQSDPRVTAANAIMKALPPSQTAGGDDNDWAALNAIRNLYFSAAPGSLERLGPARRKIAQAGLARLGYDPALVEEEYTRSLPGQLSPLLA